MKNADPIHHFETTGLSDGLVSKLFGAYWGLLPASVAAPILTLTSDPIGLLTVFLALIMASHDVVTRRIPNPLNALTALIGLGYCATSGLSSLGWGLVSGLIGLFCMGLFYSFGAVGAGDVKAIAALSIFFAPQEVVFLIVTTTVTGGFMALARMLTFYGIKALMYHGVFRLARHRSGMTLPYGLAILTGTILFVIMRG